MIRKIFGPGEIIAQVALIISLVTFGLSIAALSIALVCLLGVRNGV